MQKAAATDRLTGLLNRNAFAQQLDHILKNQSLAVLVFASFVVNATQSLSSALLTAWRLKHEMEHAHRLAMVASCTDELTGLNNRRAFYEQGLQLLQQARRDDQELSVAMLDLDHFKQINDGFGHASGDRRRFGNCKFCEVCDERLAAKKHGF